jgi:hypothetical protein
MNETEIAQLYTRRPSPISLPDNPTLTQKYADRMAESPEDGFALNPWVCYLPYVYNSSALEASALVRKANLMRGHVYTAPVQSLFDMLYSGQSIAPYATYNTQVACEPGSIILGYRYWEYDSVTGLYKAPSNIMIRVSDACTGVDIAHDYESSRSYAEFQGTGLNNLNMQFVTSPRVIAGSGQLNIEISNTTDAALVCQFLIFVAEPITLVETPGFGSTQGFAGMEE